MRPQPRFTPEEIELTVNGVKRRVSAVQDLTLLQLLRRRFGCTSVKEVCGVGECGACTVISNGEPVSSCLELAARYDGSVILTAEGLAHGDELHPIQRAMLEEGGFQCGFCTPGMVVMAKALLDEIPNPSVDQIKDYMSGNLCRCTGYWQIIRAISKAAQMEERRREKKEPAR